MEKTMIFKWKSWYWYCALLSNVLSALIIVLAIIFNSKSIIPVTDIKSIIFLSVSAPVLMSLFFTYVYKTTKESRLCQYLIKKSRFKYFSWGMLSSFIMFNSYVVLWLISYKLSSAVPFYFALPIIIICGFASTTSLTIYEFCVAFDIYYSRNKTEIIKDFFKQTEIMDEKKSKNQKQNKEDEGDEGKEGLK